MAVVESKVQATGVEAATRGVRADSDNDETRGGFGGKGSLGSIVGVSALGGLLRLLGERCAMCLCSEPFCPPQQ